jgi:lysophospholipase L1-like esterase
MGTHQDERPHGRAWRAGALRRVFTGAAIGLLAGAVALGAGGVAGAASLTSQSAAPPARHHGATARPARPEQIASSAASFFAANLRPVAYWAALRESESATNTGPNYLALGDSIAFGYRPPQVTPFWEYFDANNFVGYPEDLAADLHLDVANASCPGETTASMINPLAQSNGCENSVGSPIGYRTFFPLHVFYPGSQLSDALDTLRAHPRTQLVTIDLGVNDAFVCQETTANHCTGATFDAMLQTVETNLDTIYAALRHDGHYRGPIVALSYYSTDYANPTTDAEVQALNGVIAAATRAYGGIVANGYAAFEEASATSGGNPCTAGLLIPLPGGGCNIHPSATGQALLASTIARALGD